MQIFWQDYAIYKENFPTCRAVQLISLLKWNLEQKYNQLLKIDKVPTHFSSLPLGDEGELRINVGRIFQKNPNFLQELDDQVEKIR